MLRITPRQLAGWERAGLIAVAESYSFYDLLQIRKLSELRAKKVRPAMIRASLDAMQRQVSGMQNPLLEAGVFSRGSRLTFRHEGRELDPLAGQFLLAFDRPKIVEARTAQPRVAKTASELFVVAVALEENLARAYERLRKPRKALAHWRAYVRMDPVGAWSNYARGQMQKILENEKLRIVWRKPGLVPHAK